MPTAGKQKGRLYVTFRKIRFLLRNGSLLATTENSASGDQIITGSTSRILIFNSLSLFLLAYLFIFLLNILVTGIAAIANQIPVVLYYYGPDFLIRGKDWTIDAINIVFSSGPVFMFIFSAILIILYVSVITETGILRLFLLWAIYHAITRIFGELLVGAIMSKGFGFVIIYMFIMDTGKLILTIFAFLALFTIGIFLSKSALFSGNIYFNMIRGSHCTRFVNGQFIWPFIIGNVLIFLFKLPEMNIFEISVNASMGILLIPLIIRSNSIEDLYFDEDARNNKLNIRVAIMALISIVLFRVLFDIGIRFSV
jgi:hypothetical protein